QANDNLDKARILEKSGDALAARAALAAAAQTEPTDIEALRAYAEFLDRYGDPSSLTVYRQLLAALRKSGASDQAVAVARRIVVLDLLAGDRAAAQQDLEVYRAGGGEDWSAKLNWKSAGETTAP